MKISIKNVDAKYSDAVLKALWYVLKEKDEHIKNAPELCGETILSTVNLYTDDSNENNILISKIALMALGSNLQKNIDEVSNLRFMGDGECPECGSDDVCGDISATCDHCGHHWYRNAEDDIIIPTFRENEL